MLPSPAPWFGNPLLVVLDEPVSALDVSIQAQILNLLLDIQNMRRLTYLIIAHDLAMLQHVTDKIAVMYLGRIVEMGDTQEVFSNPLHPYTKALFEAVPQPIPGRIKKESAITGEIGNALHLPGGCRFHPRCIRATALCPSRRSPLAPCRGQPLGMLVFNFVCNTILMVS